MTFELFTAKRLSKKKPKKLSLNSIAIIGVSLSLAVMLISVSIIMGFRNEIKRYVYSQTGYISIYATGSTWTNTQNYIRVNDSLLSFIAKVPNVQNTIGLIQSGVLLKTSTNFAGISLYGMNPKQIPDYYLNNITRGNADLSKQKGMPTILLPSIVTKKMGYKIGDKILVYFYNKRSIKVRSFILTGIYDSGGIDTTPAICNINILRKIQQLNDNQYSRILVFFNDDSNLNNIANYFIEYLKNNGASVLGQNIYAMNTAQELLPNLFNWLTILDTNVYFLIVLMIIVGCFTMITGLIIIVLDKSQQIGILKSLGASNDSIRKVFLLIGGRLIILGLFYGDIIAGIFCFFQYEYKLIPLNPTTYYMNAVPISFNPLYWLAINIGVALIIMLVMIYPSRIISKISPSDTIRID